MKTNFVTYQVDKNLIKTALVLILVERGPFRKIHH